MIAVKHGDIGGAPQPNNSAVVRNGNNLSRWSRFWVLVVIPVFLKIHKHETDKKGTATTCPGDQATRHKKPINFQSPFIFLNFNCCCFNCLWFFNIFQKRVFKQWQRELSGWDHSVQKVKSTDIWYMIIKMILII